MATIQKIQASLYAIGKRMQGYHLLKNPAGTPQTEVNMVKELYRVSWHWDDMFDISRIKKTFSKDGNHEEERFLMSTHFMDVDKLEMTKPRKKDMCYSIKKDGEYLAFEERGDIEKQDERKIPKLSIKTSHFFAWDSEEDMMRKTKHVAQYNRGYYKKHYSQFTKIFTFGLHEIVCCRPEENRPNFFKLLYHNLTNK